MDSIVRVTQNHRHNNPWVYQIINVPPNEQTNNQRKMWDTKKTIS